MDWTGMLQERRLETFEDILCRWQDRQLTYTQAGELSGVGGRSFRRYCRRFGEDGIEALCERRPGRRAARRVPVDK